MNFARPLILAATLLIVAPSVESQEFQGGSAPSEAGLKGGIPGRHQKNRDGKSERLGELPQIPAKADPEKEPPKSGWSGVYLGINGGAARE